MSTDISENDLLGKTEADVAVDEDITHPLHLLQQAIASMPDVDTEKVQAAMSKLRNGSLQILGNAEERLASAKRIAAEIIAEISHTEE